MRAEDPSFGVWSSRLSIRTLEMVNCTQKNVYIWREIRGELCGANVLLGNLDVKGIFPPFFLHHRARLSRAEEDLVTEVDRS